MRACARVREAPPRALHIQRLLPHSHSLGTSAHLPYLAKPLKPVWHLRPSPGFTTASPCAVGVTLSTALPQTIQPLCRLSLQSVVPASLPPLPAQRGPERCIAGRVHDGQIGHQAGHVDARGQGVGADEEFNDSRALDLQVDVWGRMAWCG